MKPKNWWWSFARRVDAEWISRYRKRSERALRNAKLRISGASLEGVEYKQSRGIEKMCVNQLASCRWIDEAQNAIICDATGTGKTHLACALGHRACMKCYRVLCRRAPRLLQELRLARTSGEYARDSRNWRKLTCWLSTTSSPRSRRPSVRIHWKSSKTAMNCVRRCLLDSCLRSSGTRISERLRSPTRSATVSFMLPSTANVVRRRNSSTTDSCS